jgi:hypothetical protein
MNRLLRSSSKPLLAAINGTAVGGGLEMALHCDLRFAGSNAKLGQPEIRIAFIPPIAVAFVCNQESKYVVVIVAPSPGKFQNQQETVSVAVQRTENNFGSSDLLQQWDNEGNYVFEERPDELDKFTSYLKAQEADGIKSVNFYFPNDLVTGGGTTNQVVIDLSGFSRGLGAFKKKCGDTQ